MPLAWLAALSVCAASAFAVRDVVFPSLGPSAAPSMWEPRPTRTPTPAPSDQYDTLPGAPASNGPSTSSPIVLAVDTIGTTATSPGTDGQQLPRPASASPTPTGAAGGPLPTAASNVTTTVATSRPTSTTDDVTSTTDGPDDPSSSTDPDDTISDTTDGGGSGRGRGGKIDDGNP